ncbi:MAG: extracellular solute-binding protein [Chloroflexi bacterium]|nr:extracellular solute-binding protein [Chloroflexota bacterium]
MAKPSATAQPSGAGAAQPTSAPAASGSAAGSRTGASLAGTVSFWYLNSGPVEAVADAAHRLEAKYPGVKVDTQSLQNDPFKTKLNVSMGSDSPPDVWNTWGGGVLANFAHSGAALDLTGELEKGGWKDRLVAAPLDMVKVDGKIYAIPVYVNGVFFFYNKELLQSKSLTPPKTWDEMLNFVEDAKSKGLIPIGLANKTRWPGAFYLNYLVDRINGTDFLNKAVAGQASFDDPGVVEAGRRMQELVKAGAFPEGFNGLDFDTGGSRQLMYAGQTALELQTASYPATTGGEMKGFEQKLDFATFPTVPNGKGQATGLLGGMIGYAVSEKTKARDASIELLQLLTDDTARDAYVNNGRVPAIKGAAISDPMTKKIADTINGATSFQNYWDQALSPELGQEQLDVSQALLGGSITPEAAAKRLDDIAKKSQKP